MVNWFSIEFNTGSEIRISTLQTSQMHLANAFLTIKKSVTESNVNYRQHWALTDITHSVQRRSIPDGQNHQILHNIHRWEIVFNVENMQDSRGRWIVHHQTTFTTEQYVFPLTEAKWNGIEETQSWWGGAEKF
jgi:hypothetical protein